MIRRLWGFGWVLAVGLAAIADPSSGCVIDADCDDGVFCNGAGLCIDGSCVAIDPCPAAIDGCVVLGSCDEATRSCPGVPDDSLCDDGLFCNGIESCDPGTHDCTTTSDACPFAIDGCLVNAGCDEATDTCLTEPDDTLCDDGLFCNGAEHCDADTGSCFAVDPCPAAIDGCVVLGSCDEATKSCPGVPDDSLCLEGQICLPDGSCVEGTTTTTSTVTSTTSTDATSSTTSTTAVTSTTSTTSTLVTTTTTTTGATSTTTTTVPADDHPLSGAKLVLKDRASNAAKRRLAVLSRDAAQLGLADVPDVPALFASGGSLRVIAVGGDGFGATYLLPHDGWRLLKPKAPAKGLRFKARGGPITKVTLKAGKRLQILGKGAALQQSLALEPDLVLLELRVGTRRYCLAFGGTEKKFTTSKSLLRKDAGRPVGCP
jgi:hypothetical protein